MFDDRFDRLWGQALIGAVGKVGAVGKDSRQRALQGYHGTPPYSVA